MKPAPLTYPGGAAELIARHNSRREPFVFYREDLPPADADLAALRDIIVTEAATQKQPDEPKKGSTWAMKRRLIAREFVGLSELSLLNALLIANLRRSGFPPQTPALFRRLWAEEAPHLLSQLDLRWQVSSIMTFADHGETLAERQLGLGLKMLFGLMKLYEFERLYSGKPPDNPWRLSRRVKAELPVQMRSFSLTDGGLDSALLAPLYELAAEDPVAGPLSLNLLDAINADPGTVFRRLVRMKSRRERLDARKAAKRARATEATAEDEDDDEDAPAP